MGNTDRDRHGQRWASSLYFTRRLLSMVRAPHSLCACVCGRGRWHCRSRVGCSLSTLAIQAREHGVHCERQPLRRKWQQTIDSSLRTCGCISLSVCARRFPRTPPLSLSHRLTRVLSPRLLPLFLASWRARESERVCMCVCVCACSSGSSSQTPSELHFSAPFFPSFVFSRTCTAIDLSPSNRRGHRLRISAKRQCGT